jgi:tyrosine-specific transport protein
MKDKKKGVVMIALLVTGNLIGAGILALPMQTGGAGIFYSFLAMLLFCAAMYFSAIVLAREAVEKKEDNFNYPSLYGSYLGPFGKWLATAANLLILYGLLTAYIGGGTTIIVSAISSGTASNQTLTITVTLILFVALSAFTATGTGFVARYNQFLMLFLGLCFVSLVLMGAGHVELKRMLFHDIRFLPIAIPVILTAFHFHNIIPTICKDMEWDITAISRAMLLGMVVGFVMNLIWVGVGIGVLPLTIGSNSIISGYQQGLPATVPLGNILANPLFSSVAIAFSLTAICTSYAANGIGLMDFNRDILGGGSKITIMMATFLPPLIIALLFPTLFLKAIGVVGGIGIALLFGVLPSVIYFLKNRSIRARILALSIGLLFTCALIVDLSNDFNLIKTDTILMELQKEAGENNGKK